MKDLVLTDSDSGFTLIDVLVALAIAGLTGSILVGLLIFSDMNSRRVHEQTQADEDLISVSTALRILAEGAYFIPATEPDKGRPFGTPSELFVATTGPHILGLPRPTIFVMRSEAVGDRKRIVLQWRDPQTAREHLESLGGIYDKAEFSYFGEPKASGGQSWQAFWQPGSDHRLEAVKLTIRLPGQRTSVDLIAPMRSGVPVQCVINPHQPGCFVREP